MPFFPPGILSRLGPTPPSDTSVAGPSLSSHCGRVVAVATMPYHVSGSF